MFDFLDDVFTGISEFFDEAVDTVSGGGDIVNDAINGAEDIAEGGGGGGGGFNWGKLGSAALGAGVNVMKGGGGIGSRQTSGRISSGINVDRMGNERPRPSGELAPLVSKDPHSMNELWMNRMRQFSRIKAAAGGTATTGLE
jgi:hypothetical protein